jgi:hypothetical protein
LPAGDAKPISTDRLARRLIKRSAGHDIVVMHDGVEPAREAADALRGGRGQQSTVEALPAFLESLAERKLRTLTLLEALLPADAPPAPAARSPS